MINNGNNGGGNPNHASDGKFTSGPNQAGNKVEKKESYENQIKEKLGIKNDANPSYEEKMQNVMGIKKAEMSKKKFLISDSEGSLLSEEPIEASSEEEAFEIASQMFPGRGDELFVNEDAAENEEPSNKNGNFAEAKQELEKYGEAIVGEDGDRVFSVTTDGTKYYGISYRTNYNGPIDGTEEEYDSGYDTLEEAVAAMEKDGYPIYDNFKANNHEDQIKK